VDHVVPADQVRAKAALLAKAYLAIPAQARHWSKLAVREAFVGKLERQREADIDHFVRLITADKVQAGLGAYLESLKKKAQP
jgi:hypothetical protein